MDWAAWEARTLLEDDTNCAEGSILWTEDLTLRQAVLLCSPADCVGLSWLKSSDESSPETELPYSGTYTFSGCSDQGTASVDTTYASIWKANLPELNTDDDVDFDPVSVNFYESTTLSFEESDFSGYLHEGGDVFGVRDNGYTYGWHCEKLDVHNTEYDVTNPESCCTPDDTTGSCDPCTPDNTVIAAGYERTDLCSGFGPLDYIHLEFNYWKMELPNGAYDVTLHGMVAACDGCTEVVESCIVGNTQLQADDITWDDGQEIVREFSLTRQVEVYDGILSFIGNPETDRLRAWVYCPASTLDITRVGPELAPKSWLPAQTDPWIQYEFDESRHVGLVSNLLYLSI